MNIGIIGLGFVGDALHNSFMLKNIPMNLYDKYKNGGIGSFEEVLQSSIIFLCLPTLYDPKIKTYNTEALHETCMKLKEASYTGLVVIKSTVLPGTCDKLKEEYELNMIHNPEFLTARTARDDFHNQRHIVLGINENEINKESKYYPIIEFYKTYYPTAKISTSKMVESESMKIYVNSFYAMKVQIFNEFYLLCQKNGSDFNSVVNMMLNNGWINFMHTSVPGPDGQLSYGGACFPKDTSALNQYMINMESPNKILNACIEERNTMRND